MERKLVDLMAYQNETRKEGVKDEPHISELGNQVDNENNTHQNRKSRFVLNNLETY